MNELWSHSPRGSLLVEDTASAPELPCTIAVLEESTATGDMGGCKAKPVNYKRAGTMRILFISVPLEIRTECLVPTKGPINTRLMEECCGRMSRGSHCGKRRCVLGRRSSTCEGRPGEMKLTR